MSPAFDDIPDREELPPNTGEGFGVSDSKLTTMKAVDLLDQPIAVIGYLTMENQYKKTDSDPDKVTLFEVMDASGELFGFWHTSNVLRKHVERRHQREEIPFRTVLTMRPPKKAGGNEYYDFT